MANEELGHWTSYLETRKSEIENLDQVKSDFEENIDK